MINIADRIKIYKNNTGFRGMITILIFLAVFWFGIEAFLKDNRTFFIFFYIAGIITALAVWKILTRNSGKYTIALRIFILTAVIAGFAQSIPAVEDFIKSNEAAFTCVLFSLIGFFITGNFIVYSNPLFVAEVEKAEE